MRNLIWRKRGLTAGEIAVHCGHRRIWRRLVESGAPHALVLEDDFGIVDVEAFGRALEDCVRRPEGWDIIKLFDFGPKKPLLRRRLGDSEIVAHQFPPTGAVAYIIKNEAARRLLERKRFFRAVDEEFSWPWEFGLGIWSLSPNCVEEVSVGLGGSVRAPLGSGPPDRNALRAVWANVIKAWKTVRAWSYRSHMARRLDRGQKTA